MKPFVLLYKGGKAGSTPAEAEKIMKVWMQWFDKLGKTLVDGGKPFGAGKTVTAKGVHDGATASNGGHREGMPHHLRRRGGPGFRNHRHVAAD